MLLHTLKTMSSKTSDLQKVIQQVIPLCYASLVPQKLGPKGQVVIPKAVRDHLGLGPGDEVVVTLTENGALVQPASGFESLRGTLQGSGILALLEQDHLSELE